MDAPVEKFRMQFDQGHVGNPARIEAMTLLFFGVFKAEHPIDQAAAAESILATLLISNARTKEDAIEGAEAIAADIAEAIENQWGQEQ